MVQIDKTLVSIKTKDGIALSAVLYTPEKPKAVIQINAATAVPKEFYRHIALFFAENDYACLFFDYRGIGDSRPPEGLKGCEYDILDWAKEDMQAVLHFLKSQFPGLPVYFLCHSVGGQMIGFVPDINEVQGVLAISSSSGYAKHMTFSGRLKSFYFFRTMRPIIHLFFGYSKFKFLGIMEDMPKNITNTWYRWCSKPEYFFDPKNAKELDISGFKKLAIPIEIAVATDDPICPEKNVENLWKHFHSSKGIKINWLKPSDFELKSIGHFGFFRKESKDTLWPWAIEKIEQMK